MQYDQCLTKGPDGSKVMITHCNQNEYKDWQYFKVGNRYIAEKKLFASWFFALFKNYVYLKIKFYNKVN